MYCPQCQSEYQPQVTHCSDCRVPLVASLVPVESTQSELARYLRAPQSTREQCTPGPFADPDTHELAQRWDEYLRRQTAYRVSMVAQVLFVGAAALLLWATGRSRAVLIVLCVFGAIFAVAGSLLNARYIRFPCPRCEKRGGFRTRFFGLTARKCSRCGLPMPYELS